MKSYKDTPSDDEDEYEADSSGTFDNDSSESIQSTTSKRDTSEMMLQMSVGISTEAEAVLLNEEQQLQ